MADLVGVVTAGQVGVVPMHLADVAGIGPEALHLAHQPLRLGVEGGVGQVRAAPLALVVVLRPRPHDRVANERISLASGSSSFTQPRDKGWKTM